MKLKPHGVGRERDNRVHLIAPLKQRNDVS